METQQQTSGRRERSCDVKEATYIHFVHHLCSGMSSDDDTRTHMDRVFVLHFKSIA